MCSPRAWCFQSRDGETIEKAPAYWPDTTCSASKGATECPPTFGDSTGLHSMSHHRSELRALVKGALPAQTSSSFSQLLFCPCRSPSCLEFAVSAVRRRQIIGRRLPGLLDEPVRDQNAAPPRAEQDTAIRLLGGDRWRPSRRARLPIHGFQLCLTDEPPCLTEEPRR